MATPKLNSGTLYFMREQDYRSGELGPYVKLGIVRKDRTAAERAKEHQTGNPREMLTTHELQAPMVDYLETQLHHRFAEHCLRGEWFEMSPEFVTDTVLPVAEQLIREQHAFFVDFEEEKALKEVLSSGIVREPTEEETACWNECKRSKEALVLAKSRHELADLVLRAAVGESGGIEGILTLVTKTKSRVFDAKRFMAEHADVYAACLVEREAALKGSFLLKNTQSLAKLDADLHAEKKTAKAEKATFEPIQGDAPARSRTDTLKELHAQYIATLGVIKKAEWDEARWSARLANHLGKDDAIEGLVVWKREMKPQNPTLDKDLLKDQHPDLYEKFQLQPPDTVSVDISFSRSYALD
jgi:hypothetical protein